MENNLLYLLFAFLIVWIGFFGYVLYLELKQKRLEKSLQEVVENLPKNWKWNMNFVLALRENK